MAANCAQARRGATRGAKEGLGQVRRRQHLVAPNVTLLAIFGLVFAAQAGGVILPDSRVYEEVTPVHMNGTNLTEHFRVSENGQVVIYGALNAFTGSSGGEGSNGVVPFEAQRATAGWQSVGLAPPQSEHIFSGIAAASPDFSRFLVSLEEPFAESPSSSRCYIQEPHTDVEGAAPTEIDTVPRGAHSYCNIAYTEAVGASSDLSHIVIYNHLQGETHEVALVPGSPIGTEGEGFFPSLVEDYPAAGAFHYRLVGVSGANNADGSGSVISDCGTILGYYDVTHDGTGGEREHTAVHAISSDGATVFFTAVAAETNQLCSGPSVNELFARVGGSQTVPISEPATSYCPASGPNPACADAQFEGASADGSKVFFTTTQPEAPGVTDSTTNLYRAQLASSGGITSVAGMTQVSAGDTSGAGAQVQGVVRISDDGSRVYFVARGVLTTNPSPDTQGYNAHGEAVTSNATAQAGADNLYVYDNGVTSFIGDLCSGAHASGALTDAFCGANLSTSLNDQRLWGGDTFREAVAAPYGSTTADGRFLAFDTYAQLVADDTDAAKDVYLYDSQSAKLVRVSAGADGFDRDGKSDSFDASIVGPAYNDAFPAGGEENPRPIANDGSIVFFTTSEPLQRDDIDSAPDVYEWRDGQVSLITDGQDPNTGVGANAFAGSSASGSDVFFTTPDVLVPGGGENISNLYDARVGGGFPLAPIAAPCSEDACQGPLSAPPRASATATETYTGGANLTQLGSRPAPVPKPLTRAQKLAKALRACKAKHNRKKRMACNRAARKRYGSRAKTKKAAASSNRGRKTGR